MLHVQLILIFAVMILRDQGISPLAPEGYWPGWAVAMVAILPGLIGAVLLRRATARALRQMDVGRVGAIIDAERVHTRCRLLLACTHVVAVMGLGWLDVVRSWVGGDLIALDELLAAAPPVGTIILLWWVIQPIDRRLREAALLREIDEGRPIHPPPSRARAVMLNIRHQLLLTLLPLVVLTALSETVRYAATRIVERAHRDWLEIVEPRWVHRAAQWLTDERIGPGLMAGVQLVGAAVVMLLMPLLLRRAWDTTPLGDGPMRARLMALCADAGIRVRHLLVWRTSGTLVNGAVLGFVAPMRYILLTDALLERLDERQVEAVMAHEIAHVRKAHLPWMLAAMIGVVVFVGLCADAGLRAASPKLTEAGAHGVELAISLGALATALAAMGYVSRRFEWQADAFAASQLSRQDSASGGRVTAEGAGAMQAALRTVALLNHIPLAKFGFRHGSIATRLDRLAATVGGPAGALPIDRTARRLKWGVAFLVAADIAGIVLLA